MAVMGYTDIILFVLKLQQKVWKHDFDDKS